MKTIWKNQLDQRFFKVNISFRLTIQNMAILMLFHCRDELENGFTVSRAIRSKFKGKAAILEACKRELFEYGNNRFFLDSGKYSDNVDPYDLQSEMEWELARIFPELGNVK